MNKDNLKEFIMDSEAINPNEVPKKTLYTGDKVPTVGLGTFGSDRFTAEDIANAVYEAAKVGYRHFDCASVYGNEKEIGRSFSKLLDEGLSREELWVTSKLWNNMHGQGDVLKSCKQTLSDLNLEYLDLFLIHWPFPNYHAPGCDVDSRSANAKPYIHENFMETWKQMEELVDMGLVKNIGTSNMSIPKMDLLLQDARIKPSVNEMELHPHFQQKEFYDYLVSKAIQPIGFCPIGSPTRPDRDKTENDTVDIEDPVIVEIAKTHKVHPAVICIKWAHQRGQIPIPFSIRKNEFLSNLQSSVTSPLTDDEMNAISNLNKNTRLIKGQVFLWKDDQSWEDLWDLNGTIAK